ncbi:hypothetical protein FRC19_003295 [Serendipita sp. 401]|nr:hypothetical protein FRC19_003295 [Serendipita sp. 401]KAG9022189.1 hypothetical protein FS842_006258 [Serendipita sp. 407]
MSETNKRDDTWSAAEYNNTASFVYSDKYTQPVLDLLQATAGERILDLGCGTGELTKALQNIVGTRGVIVGIDASANMIEKARGNGVINARVMDAQNIVWDPEGDFTTGNFDAVFSNATLQWCKESPSSVIEHTWQALKPGGRFVAEMPGFASMAGVRASIHSALARRGYNPRELDPWYFPSDTTYRSMLEKQGFRVDSIGLFPRLTHVPNGLKAWIDLFARKSMLGSLTEAQADEIIEEVLRECEIDMCDEEGRWFLVSMRLRFKATKAL